MTRTARILTAAAIAAIAMLALAAPGASAQHGVEVKDELDGNAHCNPCEIHMTSIGQTIFIVEGVGPVTACQDEFEGEVYEDGEGHITQQTIAGDVGTCFVEPCTLTPSEAEWPIELREEDSELHFSLTFCVTPRGTYHTDESHCTLHGVQVVDVGTHHWVINPARDHRECEEPPHRLIEGSWEITPEPEGNHTNIEIEHN